MASEYKHMGALLHKSPLCGQVVAACVLWSGNVLLAWSSAPNSPATARTASSAGGPARIPQHALCCTADALDVGDWQIISKYVRPVLHLFHHSPHSCLDKPWHCCSWWHCS